MDVFFGGFSAVSPWRGAHVRPALKRERVTEQIATVLESVPETHIRKMVAGTLQLGSLTDAVVIRIRP